MILSVIILLLVGVIAFFHYVQGFFSATLSAMITVIAAVLAVSYQEPVVNALLKGKMADQANAMMLCVVFAVVYIVLRLIFDKAIPGNVRVPVIVDKVGAGIMGLVAGIFATGIFALAAQMLPFGPSIGGYNRYALRDPAHVTVPMGNNRQDEDSFIYDELTSDRFEPENQKSLLIPVDDILLATVQHLSNGGTLAGARPLSSIHPDYSAELFGDRLGIQVGARHSALNLATTHTVSVPDVYAVSSLPTADPELKRLRSGRKVPPVTTPKGDQMLLVVRIMIGHNAADDTDNLFRFSTGSIRLVANDKDYFPIGTVDNASTLFSQKLDDFLFLNLGSSDAGIDAAFLVDKADLFGDSGDTETIPPGRFIEVKHFGQVDLGGMKIDAAYTSSPSIAVMRKKGAMEESKMPAAPVNAHPVAPVNPSVNTSVMPSNTPPAVATPEPASPSFLNGGTAKVSPTLSYPIGVNGIDEDAVNTPVAGGTVSMKGGKFISVTIDPSASLEKLATADNKLSDLFQPDGRKIVQVTVGAPADGWGWAGNVGSIKLTDSNNNSYAVNGVYTVVSNGGTSGLFMRFDVQKPLGSLTPPAGTPGSVTCIFVVPSGTQLKTPISVNVP